MRNIFTVFKFTFRDGIRKKTFIISTSIVLLLILGACLIGGLLGAPEEEGMDGGALVPDIQVDLIAPEERGMFCYVIDDAYPLPQAIAALNMAFGDTGFIKIEASQQQEYLDKVEIEENTCLIEIHAPAQGQLPSLTLFQKNALSAVPVSSYAEVIQSVCIQNAMQLQGVEQDTIDLALSGIHYSVSLVGKMDLSGYVLGVALCMLMFFAIYFYGYGVATSVASEKTSRVMETLIMSAKPSHILLGKCLAMGALGLLQLSAFLVFGLVCYNLLVPGDLMILGAPLAISSFSIRSGLLTLVYFILGFFLFAMINSVCGASVSRSEDLQSAMMPTVFIGLGSFYAAFFGAILGGGPLKAICTYIPLTSPFLMPFRLLNDTVSTGEIIGSIALLIVGIALVAALSIRIYTHSVLHYGQRLKMGEMLRMKTR